MTTKFIATIIKEQNEVEKLQCPFPTGTMRIYLNRLAKNIQTIVSNVSKQRSRPPLFLLPIKANAYGSGMIPVARYVEQSKLCAYLGVAHPGEAFLLRNSGIIMPILSMGEPHQNEEEIRLLIEQNIEQSVSSESTLYFLNTVATKMNKKIKIHLDIDTGMGRTGIFPRDLEMFLEALRECVYVELVGVMTHFSVSDSLLQEDIAYTKKQIDVFNDVRNTISRAYAGVPIVFHTSNSSGCVGVHTDVFDMIRPGIAVYGYGEYGQNVELQPVMELTTKITLIKQYPKDHCIGYGCTYKTKKDGEKIAIIPIGYGDGLSRSLSNIIHFLVNGKQARSVGRISMDQCALLVDEDVCVGDEVIIVGTQGNVKQDASDIAKLTGTISYEVLCTLGNSSRVRCEYFLHEPILLA